jgi:hypothetical protein
LPNFSTLIGTNIAPINQSENVSKEQSNELKPNFILSKPPPDYNEATKQNSKSKVKKKSVKSQAVDDVLEILIKNGELPPSAANDPTTPTTPEKIQPILKTGINNLFPVNNNEKIKPTNIKINDEINNNSNNNGNINIDRNSGNQQCIINHKTPDIDNTGNSNTTLDLDFILDLEGLTESIESNIAINERSSQNDKINNNNNTNIINPLINSSKINNPLELSLTEFMDFQDNCNIEDTNWFEMSNTSSIPLQSNQINVNYPNEQQFTESSNLINRNNGQTCLPNQSKHDPILPNTMFGGNIVDPLLDFYEFDDNDVKTPIDYGALVWDKVDFAT